MISSTNNESNFRSSKRSISGNPSDLFVGLFDVPWCVLITPTLEDAERL